MAWSAPFLGFGCAPKPVTAADLRFPVVVIFGTTAIELYRDQGALGQMLVNHLNAVREPPPLIDSTFEVYTLAHLGSTHNGLWLMAHPTGSTPVSFDLERRAQTGIAVARQLLRERLDDQTWRADLTDARAALEKSSDLGAMFKLVKGG